MANKKAYTVNTEKKIITLDDSVKLTAAEEKDITRYVNAGYLIKHKSKKKSEQATKRANTNISNEEIIKALENDEKGLAKYNEIKKGSGKGNGFFAARSWYKKNYLNK